MRPSICCIGSKKGAARLFIKKCNLRTRFDDPSRCDLTLIMALLKPAPGQAKVTSRLPYRQSGRPDIRRRAGSFSAVQLSAFPDREDRCRHCRQVLSRQGLTLAPPVHKTLLPGLAWDNLLLSSDAQGELLRCERLQVRPLLLPLLPGRAVISGGGNNRKGASGHQVCPERQGRPGSFELTAYLWPTSPFSRASSEPGRPACSGARERCSAAPKGLERRPEA